MRHIIFDFDGTIANSSIVFMNGWNEFADQYGYLKVDENDILAARQMTIQQCAKKFQFPMYKMPIILPKIYRYFKLHLEEVVMYDGIHDSLKALKEQGLSLYILSSNNKENITRYLELHNITEIDEIFTSSKLFGKDRVLKRFMKERNLLPNDLFYIGDELRDIEACNKCNINFGWASWGLHGIELIGPKNPKLLFRTPQDIQKQLLIKKEVE